MEMNILFSSDDNYAQHLGVAMYSLMIHNKKAKKLNFFVVDNHISEDNLSKLKQVIEGFCNSTINFIPFDSYAKELQLDMPWPISMSAYARLFAADLLPKDMERVLYLDCDMVINHDLTELWEYELGDYCIGAVQDQVSPNVKEAVGMNPRSPYFNSGMLLVELKKWREHNVCSRAMEYIKKHQGRVIHHDQGVLNGIFCDNWLRLPLKYNVMTVHYLMSLPKIRHFYKDPSFFYSNQEADSARFFPFILHYTPSFTSRPWEENCLHPLRSLYSIILARTSWHNDSQFKDSAPWYIKIINWRYRNLPL